MRLPPPCHPRDLTHVLSQLPTLALISPLSSESMLPRRLIGCLLAVVATGACRQAIPPLGTTPDQARRNADNVFAAFAFRFYNVQRDARFSVARPRMARYALIPSRIFGDTMVWSEPRTDSVRTLYLHGGMTDRGYTFSARASAPYPTRLGDERHFMQLTRLGDDSYEWITHVDHGIGPVTSEEVAGAIGVLFTAFDGRRGAAVEAEARQAFPRSTRHLGQLFTLDSLRSTPLADGTTTFGLHLTFTPDTLRARYPAFAAYLDKYVTPSRLRLRLADRGAAPYVEIAMRDGRADVRLRAHRGSLVALSGAPRPLPDSLKVHMDLSAKMMLFRVGFHDLVGDFTIEHGEREHAWMLRFRREPKWDFPLATDRLIKSPLRRPFEGRGSELRLAVRDDLGNQAMSVRQIRTAVRESAIMRWLGGLGASAFGDFEGRSEAEENRFLMELFGALRQDVAALSF